VKRSTKRGLFRGSLYVLFVAAAVGLVLAADWEAISESFFDLAVLGDTWPGILVVAAKNTAIYTVIAFVGGLLGGLLLALMKLSPVAPYRWVSTAYIEFFRGLPALLVIFAFAFAVPIAFDWRPPGGSNASAGLVGLIVVSAAYIAETLRAGIQAVPKGQVEAAKSLGMSPLWSMLSIVLPQAFRIVIPPLTNEFVIIIKDTSLLFIAGMAANERELTTFARDSVSESINSTPLLAAALMYLIITLPLTYLVARLERRTQKAR
jgi:polar amino acid transport system permease protein